MLTQETLISASSFPAAIDFSPQFVTGLYIPPISAPKMTLSTHPTSSTKTAL